MPSLPKWIPLTDCKKIFSILKRAGGECRLVGGCVRDIILQRSHTDIDIATTCMPETVLTALNAKNIKTIPTGLKHGTVTAVLNNRDFEITTLRKDVETDGRHAIVEYTNSWKEDAQRRDFTINSMSMDLEGNLHDYFDGKSDIKSKLVKFVGNPTERIKEDYLRILRYFRFISYFGDKRIDKKSLNACSKLKDGLKTISGERIRVEMFKILSSTHVKEAIKLMHDQDILLSIGIEKLSDQYLTYDFSSNHLANLATLLRLSSINKKSINSFASLWRLSNKEKYRLIQLTFFNQITLDLPNHLQKRCIYKLGGEMYSECITVLNIENPSKNYQHLLNLAMTWDLPKFEINGENITKLGYNGPQVGKILNKLHNMWIESDFELSKEQLLSRIKNG
jgi:poly(A) polymerase